MEILEGAAAFAVVMIVFSTIVTGMAEAFLRLLAVRQTVLADAIERLIVDEIVPATRDGLKGVLDLDRDGRLSAGDVAMLKAKLSLSPLARTLVGAPFREMRFGHEKITTYSLLQRLAKSELGDALAKEGRGALRARLTDIARTYERYAAAARERFRYKAHRYTAVIAVLFAFAANIDAGRIFTYVMDNPGARQALLASAEAARAEYDAAAARLDAAMAGEGEAAPKDAAAAAARALQTLETYREDVRLPIGPGYYPYCGLDVLSIVSGGGAADEAAKDACGEEADRSLPGWIAYTLLAGVMIGLGGPFWYKVYASLSRVIGFARSLGGGEVIDEKSGDQPASRRALTEEDIVTTFEIARAGRAGG